MFSIVLSKGMLRILYPSAYYFDPRTKAGQGHPLAQTKAGQKLEPIPECRSLVLIKLWICVMVFRHYC